MKRAPKGAVVLINSNGRLQARFHWRGKRWYWSLGVADTPMNRRLVAGRVAALERDLVLGEFTGDFSKYEPQAAVTPVVTPMPRLLDLWDKFVEYKRPQLAISTLQKVYGRYGELLSRCPYQQLEQATQIRDWIVQTQPPITAKRLLQHLAACGKWAVHSGLLETNPFAGMATTITIPKSDKTDEIDPFAADERDAIIQAFEQSPHYRHYGPLVKFLFLTGCRPAEALALEWSHIQDGVIHFQQTTVNGQRGVIKRGLKTQAARKFPVNRQLQALLDSIPRTSHLVFPSPTGRLIDWTNFQNRAWATCLKQAGVRYRKPYQVRHTFITMALQRGLSVQDVAKLVGNSAEVIYRHYAGASRELVVPEL
ncbi:MAG: site-specific integrase [Gloeomargarita sp. SKYG116]|nr:site-specific integrase [Gloeomargarita sp. SKYG116]MCS7225978.1 site-specific integrase [Gloeomargarita sp. SKYB31]MDW8402095.1 tyrosine-type recombinase/integrase [Gloeomargarita sp. SKYGB_i_bin116]